MSKLRFLLPLLLVLFATPCFAYRTWVFGYDVKCKACAIEPRVRIYNTELPLCVQKAIDAQLYAVLVCDGCLPKGYEGQSFIPKKLMVINIAKDTDMTVDNVFFHEMGHWYFNAVISDTNGTDLEKAVDSDVSSWSQAQKLHFLYYTDPSEAYAEAFAIAFGHSNDVSPTLLANTVTFVRKTIASCDINDQP